MSGGATLPHERARALLGAWAAGILDPEMQDVMDRHIEECPTCGAAAEALRPDDEASSRGDHLPSTLIATWDRTAPTLRGGMRELVQGHLERCESCREELTALGQRAVLPPALELVGDAAPPAAMKRPAWNWIYGVSAGALAAAAGILILVNSEGLRTRPPSPTNPTVQVPAGPSGGTTTPAPSPPAPSHPDPSHPASSSDPARGLSLALGPRPSDAFALPESYRGSSAAPTPTYAFTGDAQSIAFDPPRALAVAEEGPLEISLLDDAGNNRFTLRTSVESLFPAGVRRAIVLNRGDAPLTPGRYTLRIRRPADAGSPIEESLYVFELR
ncbi:MAG: zf-HC2 domain-containing protein [Candidatus Eiseniibacteriota bacterium]